MDSCKAPSFTENFHLQGHYLQKFRSTTSNPRLLTEALYDAGAMLQWLILSSFFWGVGGGIIRKGQYEFFGTH